MFNIRRIVLVQTLNYLCNMLMDIIIIIIIININTLSPLRGIFENIYL